MAPMYIQDSVLNCEIASTPFYACEILQNPQEVWLMTVSITSANNGLRILFIIQNLNRHHRNVAKKCLRPFYTIACKIFQIFRLWPLGNQLALCS